jgi:UDP-N-acetylmuramate dehydrogenase
MDFKENVTFALHTTLKVGGPAKFFCEAKDEQEISEALEFARRKNLPVFVLGGGSNILVSDQGFEGLVIKIQNSSYSIRDTGTECGAGCMLSMIVSETVKAGLTGLEWAAGIPGTIGGAVRGNAGAFNGSMADIVQSVSVLEIPNPKSQIPNKFQLPITNYQLRDCQFAYRESIFKQNPNLVILSAALELAKGDREESEKKVKDILAQRSVLQPTDSPSSGSFFKNPKAKNKKLIEEYMADTGKDVKDDVVPAGYLIERLDLRGKKIGGAMVSPHHGNFLVNIGGAKAEDFIILAALIKTRARNKFGLQLQEEVQMVGF